MYAKPRKTQLIGLTGGIASGKTLVSDYLKQLGYPIIDTDQLSRVAFNMPSTQKRIKALFGTTDRERLREIVFLSKTKKKRLENVLHPIIWSLVEEQVAMQKKKKTPPTLIFIIVPLLFETNSKHKYDKVISVITSKKKQLERLIARDRVPPKLAKLIIQSQLPNSVKVRESTYILHNNRTKLDLKNKTRLLLSKLQKRLS